MVLSHGESSDHKRVKQSKNFVPVRSSWLDLGTSHRLLNCTIKRDLLKVAQSIFLDTVKSLVEVVEEMLSLIASSAKI